VAKKWFFGTIGMVLLFGGILLADHGPDYGVPRVVGEICSFVGCVVGVLPYSRRNEWPFIGVFFVFGVTGVLLFASSQGNDLLMDAGSICLLVAILAPIRVLVLRRQRGASRGPGHTP